MAQSLGRREQNRLAVRERLLQAAIDRLSVKPLEDVTVEALSERAGVSRKTFYNHYRSRQDVIEAVSQRLLMDQSEKNYAIAMSRYPGTRERLECFLTLQGRNLSDQPLLERNLIRYAMLDLSLDGGRSRAKLEQTVVLYERMFSAGRVLGDLNEHYSPRFLAEMVAGALNTSAIHWIHFPDYPLNERYKELKQLLLDIALQ